MDPCSSKMSQNYLRQMEEKIFHVKMDKKDADNVESNRKVGMYLHGDKGETKQGIKEDDGKCVVYSSPSVGQFPKEILNQLSHHSRFELQYVKSTPTSAENKILNIKNPEIQVTESTIQMNTDKRIIDLMHIDSTRSFASSVSRCSSTPLPMKPPPGRRRNQKNIDLFNPNYGLEKANSNVGSLGRSLLESIRAKVFGMSKTTIINSDDDEWNCETYCTNRNLKFPRETRHAMSTISFESRMCTSCSKQLKKTPTTDAQTSPIVSDAKLKLIKNAIPCPLNLLCDRGIHVGRCDDLIREKVHSQLCDDNCSCRNTKGKDVEKFNDTKQKSVERKYPGCAKPVSHDVGINCPSEISFELQSNDSQETILKLMEPQRDPDSDYDVLNDSTETFLQLMEPHVKTKSQFTIIVPSPLPIAVINLDKTSSITMNGMNGHANGDLNGCGDIITQNQQKGCWTIGLINSKYRYLTAETFGFKINANGASLKKKQIWTLEPENNNGGDSLIYLKSHLDKYLAVDSFGNVTCESEEKEPGCQFQISVSEDGSGRWALKNVVRGYFLGSTSDKLTCTAKVPGDAEFWHIHLAARPQVNLRSIGRKRFAHLSENLDEIHVDANIPWGEDTLFTLEFRLDESGKYAIHTCNNKYLSMGGKLVDACNKDCLFSAEYHSGQLALRDRTGAYLSPIGSKAVLKTRSNTVTKDELFSLEDSLPQASFVASLNSRFVSVKQGVDVTANQDEISDHETFQLEFDWSTKRWYIRTMQDRYWTLETGGGIQASGDKRSSNALFDLIWQGDGSVAFRANNGRYVITKRSGHLYATADTVEDNCKYYFYLINRPILVLKCEQGFVGYKSASSPKLECNKATYECIQVERGEKGVVHFKGQNGKYWHVDSEGVTADSDTQEGFYLELREPTRLCIKSVNGNYLTASKNGLFRLGDVNFESATQWEY